MTGRLTDHRARQAVRDFLDAGPRFAQLTTVNAAGAPVTRTVGAEVTSDWTVEMVTRAGHARLQQLAYNPQLQLVFVAEPRSAEPAAEPAVIDYGLPVPRVVALRGRAEMMSATDTLSCFRHQTKHALAAGNVHAPVRSDDDVLAKLVGVRARIDQVRAEGFGDHALAETWAPTADSVSTPNPRGVT